MVAHRIEQRLNVLRHAGEVDIVGEGEGTKQDEEHHGGGLGGFVKCQDRLAQVEPPLDDDEQEGACRAHAGAFGGGEDAQIDAAHDEDEQQHGTADALQRPDAVHQRQLRFHRQVQLADAHGDDHRKRIAENADDARHDAGEEQLADVLLGHDPVEDEDHRRRDENAQRAACRDGGGGKPVRIAILAHGGQGDLRHGRGCGKGRAADGREPAAGEDGGHRQSAAPVPQPGIGGVVEILRDARLHDEVAHHQEEGKDRQGVAAAVVKEGLAQQGEGRVEADDGDRSGGADGGQRKADRDSGGQKGEEDEDADFPMVHSGLPACSGRRQAMALATRMRAASPVKIETR